MPANGRRDLIRCVKVKDPYTKQYKFQTNQFIALSYMFRLVRTIVKVNTCNLRLKCVYDGRYIILPVVLYGCETWSLTLREGSRLWVFGNRVLRRIIGPKRDEIRGERRKLHNEEVKDLYSSPNILRVKNRE